MTAAAAPKNSLRTKGKTSVTRVTDDWYVVCTSRALRNEPLAVTLFDIPLVLFRTRNQTVGALLDRCPHRNIPLSRGTVKGTILECAYHGWQFDHTGTCRMVPCLLGPQESRGRNATAFHVREQQGYIWVYATPDVEPRREPFRFPLIDEQGYASVSHEFEVDASVHATAENALDVPHTAFLHGGLFRTAVREKRELEVVIRRLRDSVQAEYVGENRPGGIVARLLAPREGRVEHVDRFILPSIVQVEYRLGDSVHVCVTSALTPVHDFRTRLFVLVSLRLRLPPWMIIPLVRPFLLRIFRQDAEILGLQSDSIRRFGGEQFSSTEIDVLGSWIYRMLKEAERGERRVRDDPVTRKVRLLV